MLKQRFMRFLLVILSLLILLGVGLLSYKLYHWREENNYIKMDIQFGEPMEVQCDTLAMLPGVKNEFHITPYRDKPGVYDLTFSFIDYSDKESVYAEYVYVIVEYNEEEYCHQTLKSLFEAEDFTISVDLTQEIWEHINVVYYIPSDVGNELQGASADFELFVTAKER